MNLWDFVRTNKERWLILLLFTFSFVMLQLPHISESYIHRELNRIITKPVRSVVDWFQNSEDALRRLKELVKENSRLSQELHNMRVVQAENLRLRELLDFSTESGIDFIPARVTHYDWNGPLTSFTIDKGAIHGVGQYRPVLTPQGLVGKVEEVDKDESTVDLFTSEEFNASGLVIECNEVGIVKADNTGKLTLEGLNLRTEVKAGNRVVTSGLDEVFPVGIPIGIIESIGLDPLGVHKIATVIPVVQLNCVKEVIVLTDSDYVKADPLWVTLAEDSLSALWPDFSSVNPDSAYRNQHPVSMGQVRE